jgi:hypothetical protein
MAKTKTISSKVRNKTRVSTLSTVIQHSLVSPGQRNKTGRRNKKKSKRNGRSQTTLFCRQHNLIPTRPKKLLDIIHTFGKVAGYKINYKNQ